MVVSSIGNVNIVAKQKFLAVKIMIDERHLLTLLKLWKKQVDERETDYTQSQWLGRVIEEINIMPKVGEWTPCSEMLPKKPVYGQDGYIVQNDDIKEAYSAYWDGEKWTDLMDDEVKGVIAWMPLPDPYKE